MKDNSGNKFCKIMMVGPYILGNGGISKVVREYRDCGLFEKFKIDYFTTFKKGQKIDKILFYLKALINIILNLNKYEIVHVQTASKWSFRRLSVIISIGKIFNKKIVVQVHGGGFEKYYKNSCYIEKEYIKKIFSITDKVILLSKIWENKLTFIYNGKIEIIPNSIDTKKITLSPNYALKKSNKNFNIIFLGEIIKRKGIFDLIDAVKVVSKKNINIMLHICGEGEIEYVKKYTEDLNINRNILIHGYVSGIKKKTLLRNAHVFVLPSYVENFPMSIVEAMSYGIPCISTSIGCIGDIIDDQINGFIISPGDIDSIVDRIEFLINNVDKRIRMSNLALEKIIKFYDMDRTLSKLDKVYNSVLA